MSTKADYATLSVVKDYLKITGTVEDATLSRLITGASDWIDTYCGRTFGSDAGTIRLLNGAGSRRQKLPEDLVSVSLLEVALYENSAYLTVPSTDYFLEPDGSLMPGWPYLWIEMGLLPTTSVGAFYRGHRTVRVTGTWGWVAVPATITECCIEIVSALHKRRLTGPGDIIGTTETGQQVIGKLIPSFVKVSLGTYQRIAFASSSSG